MLDSDGYLKVIDFGISRKCNRLEKAKTFAGNQAHMAPEMINNMKYDKSIDWWAVGVMMYEMLVGCNPFNVGDLSMS